jgi:hypothetical protein
MKHFTSRVAVGPRAAAGAGMDGLFEVSGGKPSAIGIRDAIT